MSTLIRTHIWVHHTIIDFRDSQNPPILCDCSNTVTWNLSLGWSWMSVFGSDEAGGPAPSLSYPSFMYQTTQIGGWCTDDAHGLRSHLGKCSQKIRQIWCARIWKGVHLRTEMRREMTRRYSIRRRRHSFCLFSSKLSWFSRPPCRWILKPDILTCRSG